MLNHIHEKAYMFEQLAGFGYKFSVFDVVCNCEIEDGKNILTLSINYSEKKNHLLVYIFNSKEDLNNFINTEAGVKYIFEIIINTSDNTAELRSNISIIN